MLSVVHKVQFRPLDENEKHMLGEVPERLKAKVQESQQAVTSYERGEFRRAAQRGKKHEIAATMAHAKRLEARARKLAVALEQLEARLSIDLVGVAYQRQGNFTLCHVLTDDGCILTGSSKRMTKDASNPLMGQALAFRRALESRVAIEPVMTEIEVTFANPTQGKFMAGGELPGS